MATQVPRALTDALDPYVNYGDGIFKNTDRSDSDVEFVTLIGRASSNVHWTFRKLGASSGYVVPTGKKLILFALKATCSGGTGAGTERFGFQTGTSDVGFDSASSASNLDGASDMPLILGYVPSAKTLLERSFLMVVPAGRYVQGYKNAGTVDVMAFGYLVSLAVTDLND